jgi:hypothetical protein
MVMGSHRLLGLELRMFTETIAHTADDALLEAMRRGRARARWRADRAIRLVASSRQRPPLCLSCGVVAPPPADCYYLGDDLGDIQAARRVHPVAVEELHHPDNLGPGTWQVRR